MDIFKKLPERQVKLILILITLIIIVCSYFFGFQRFNSKADKLETENQTLSAEKADLQNKNNNKEKVIAETAESQDKAKEFLDKFPAGLAQDKNIIFVNELMNYAGMKTSMIGLGENTIFYTDISTEVPDISADNQTIADSQQYENKYNLTGYKTSINLTYQSTYAGLKKCIDYVNNHKDRMNIPEFTASFDGSTGNLSGTMTIDLYALLGTGKQFDNVSIRNIEIGTDNIFGTFELPINNTSDIVNSEIIIEDNEVGDEAVVNDIEVTED